MSSENPGDEKICEIYEICVTLISRQLIARVVPNFHHCRECCRWCCRPRDPPPSRHLPRSHASPPHRSCRCRLSGWWCYHSAKRHVNIFPRPPPPPQNATPSPSANGIFLFGLTDFSLWPNSKISVATAPLQGRKSTPTHRLNPQFFFVIWRFLRIPVKSPKLSHFPTFPHGQEGFYVS